MIDEALPVRELRIESEQIKDADLALRAINNVTRRRILYLLKENERMNVSTLYLELGKPRTVTSVHLSILKKVGIVIRHKEKQSVFYSVDFTRLRHISEIAEQLLCF